MYDTTPEQEMKETVAETLHEENEKKIDFYRANVDSFCRFIFVELIIERFECR